MHRRWLRTVSSAISSNRNRRHRARRHAGAAARAGIAVDLRNRRSANPRTEAYRANRTLVATDPALDTLLGQTIPSRMRLDGPGPDLQFAILQRAIAAGFRAFAAERAFAPREIDFRIAVPDADDRGRADRRAGTATCAGAQEQGFGERPWWPLRRASRTEPSAQEITATEHPRILASTNANGHPGWVAARPCQWRQAGNSAPGTELIRRRSRPRGDARRAIRHSSLMPPAPAGANPPGCRDR